MKLKYVRILQMRKTPLVGSFLLDPNTFFIEGIGTIVEDSYSGGFNSYTNYGLENMQVTSHNFPRSDLYVGNLSYCTYAFDIPTSVITISNCTNYNVGDPIPMIASLTVTIDGIANVPWTQDFVDEMMFYGKGGTQIITEYQQGVYARHVEPPSGPSITAMQSHDVTVQANNTDGFTREFINYLQSNVGKQATFRIEIKTVPTIRLLLRYTPTNGRAIAVYCDEYTGCRWTEYCDEYNPITIALPANQQCNLSCSLTASGARYDWLEFPITLTEDLTTKTINFVQTS